VTVQGKLLVASDERDAARLEALVDRAAANKIEVRRLSAAELHEMEPEVAGVGALLVPATGSVDYVAISRTIQKVVAEGGGQVELGQAVTGIDEQGDQVVLTTESTTWRARRLVVCAGLQADRMASLAGLTSAARIVPFRGEYYQLPEERRGIVTRLIYPVPDPALPFLGVHLTPMVDGRVTVGPNAVLGLAREGYRKGSVNRRDVRDIVSFPGFWRLARRQARTGAIEMRNSLFRRGYLAAARRYCPGLELSDLLPMEAGIRAQAVLRDGTMVHDFLLEETARTLHVLNAPSPAATSAIPIGEMIAEKALAAA
jgi:L-2-hydroxyglutarate oxidase